MNWTKIAIGSDHGGFLLKQGIVAFLAKKKGLRVFDAGTFSTDSVDYPDTAFKVAGLVSGHKTQAGILICKSGIGNSIAANKFKGVRAALCYNVEAAELSRRHNDANILVLGSLFVGRKLAKKMISVWLDTPFEGGRHLKRLKKIEKIEQER